MSTASPQYRYPYAAWFVVVLCFQLMSCKTAQPVSTEKPPKIQAREANQLYNKLGEKHVNINWLSGKIDSKVNFKGNQAEFTTNFRYKQDSILWFSISPALGIEVVRTQLTGDSVFFLNKLNKQFYTGPFQFLRDLVQIEDIDLCLVQDLLTGSPMLVNDNEKWRAEMDSIYFVLKNVPGKRLRKSLGIEQNEDFDLPGDSLYLYDEVSRKLSKVLRKRKDNDRYLKRYFLNQNYDLEKVILTDVLNNRVMTVLYRNFQVIDGNTLPTAIVIDIADSKESSHFELTFTKLKTEPFELNPFKVPDSYAPISK
ncbi:MAG TPA: DUF4292 domain-containing protein [Luteibaculaceae bacterium]|nr:DUF4292 domain-containing protein [Luteibaculaceae bacterium]